MTVGTDPINPITDVVASREDRSVAGSWVKVVLLAVGIGVLLCIVYFSPLKNYLDGMRQLSRQIQGFGPLAPLVFVGSVALLVAVGFPRLAFCVLAGMALGFWPGLLWGQLGTLLGNYALFLTARAFGHDWAQRKLHKRPGLQRLVQQRGILGVFLARQVPVPGVFINLACALLPIRQGDFLTGTILGQLPQAIPCTLIGAGLLQASFKKSIALVGLAIVVSFAAGLFVRQILRGRQAPETTVVKM